MESTSSNQAASTGNNKKEYKAGKKFGKWQDNRDKKRLKQQKKFEFWASNADGQKPKNQNGEGEYKTMEYAIGSVKFDEYYQKQFPDMSAEEFKDFTKTL